jgi:hypothetical protein
MLEQRGYTCQITATVEKLCDPLPILSGVPMHTTAHYPLLSFEITFAFPSNSQQTAWLTDREKAAETGHAIQPCHCVSYWSS